ncbi:MFS transporter, partial [Kitasatospora sp. NPDC093558]|uniref:MFS transporter n=1 Tax=Kitasatospora sp. NPDC093558 TaxID=3155201 RepID=UPI0034490BA3
GRRRVFRVGVAGFLLASLACAAAPTLGALIAFRAVQGAAAALIVPQTIGLIKAMFRGDDTARALGSIGPVMGLAAVCGPVLGGVLTHADLFGSSWRAVFLVNVPLSLAVLALAPLLAEDRAPRRPGLDPAGTALAVLATALLVLPLLRSGSGLTDASSLASLAAGCAIAVAFAAHQRRGARSGRGTLVETSLFGSARFPAALVCSALFFGVGTGLTLVVVLQLQVASGADALTAGLTLLPCSAGMAAASWCAGAYLVHRYGSRVRDAGLAVLAAGILATAGAFGASSHRVLLPCALAVVGIGQGLFTPSFFSAALQPLRPQEIGSAAGLLNAVQQLGTTVGVAALGRIYLTSADTDGAQRACWAGLAALAVVAAVGRAMRAGSAPAAEVAPQPAAETVEATHAR